MQGDSMDPFFNCMVGQSASEQPLEWGFFIGLVIGIIVGWVMNWTHVHKE